MYSNTVILVIDAGCHKIVPTIKMLSDPIELPPASVYSSLVFH